MASLADLKARELLDARGEPTVEVEVTASGGARGRVIASAGSSLGRYEARQRRDGDPQRYAGRGVRQAVGLVNAELAPALAGLDLDDQRTLDARLIEIDGTADRSRIGANALLPISLAAASAAAAARGEELFVHLHRLWREQLGPDDAPDSGPVLPLPLISLISGGPVVGPDFQDFLIAPLGAGDFSEALRIAADVRRKVACVLRDYAEEAYLVADGGGFAPHLRINAQGVQRILEAIIAAGLRPGDDIAIALDADATRFFNPATGCYHLVNEGGDLPSGELVDLLEHWTRQFPIASIEDGLAEDDWDAWTALTARIGDRIQVVGGDLFATCAERIRTGAARGAANAVLVKPYQVSTLSETFDALLAARRAGYRAIISGRSGGSEDTTLADLAVATGAGQVKFGALARAEHTAKYNRLLRIAEVLGGESAPYAGRAALPGA